MSGELRIELPLPFEMKATMISAQAARARHPDYPRSLLSLGAFGSIRVDHPEENAARALVAGDLQAILHRQIDIRARRVVLAVAEPVTRRNPHARAERNAVIDARVVV